jgi:hypothetical protein
VAEIFFPNFEAKIGALVALYVWTLGLQGFFDNMMFTKHIFLFVLEKGEKL